VTRALANGPYNCGHITPCSHLHEPTPARRVCLRHRRRHEGRGVKRAWATAVLKAHGYKPTFTDTANFDGESRTALAKINLHFHDLRREAGSRWLEGGVPLHLEGGVPLHTVRDWLGHTDISQTSTYLSGTATSHADAMAQFEARKNLVRNSGTQGKRRPKTAGGRIGKPRKTGIDRGATIN
jgi:integrase